MQFDRSFDAEPGEVFVLRDGVRRITAPNPGPMTFTGTNSYLVGTDRLAIIDPGPDSAAHFDAIMKAVGGARVEALVVTHTHKDHSPLARALQDATGAPIVGAGEHRYARPFAEGDAALDLAVDEQHSPDRVLSDGERVAVGGFSLQALATPGHTLNHLCFALEGTGLLFSGDHVMAWSTSLIAPPEGEMRAYLESLSTLLAREDEDTAYLPGHGAIITDPQAHGRALYAHRMEREKSISTALEKQPMTIPALVSALYEGLDARLQRAAGLSVLAHLEKLAADGIAQPVTPKLHGSQTAWRLSEA